MKRFSILLIIISFALVFISGCTANASSMNGAGKDSVIVEEYDDSTGTSGYRVSYIISFCEDRVVCFGAQRGYGIAIDCFISEQLYEKHC
jgi:hypothetical protein